MDRDAALHALSVRQSHLNRCAAARAEVALAGYLRHDTAPTLTDALAHLFTDTVHLAHQTGEVIELSQIEPRVRRIFAVEKSRTTLDHLEQTEAPEEDG